MIDLKLKVVRITAKHKKRITRFFNKFLCTVRTGSRFPIKDLQKLLGLQIWVSTVFRVARNFLTSICDLLKATRGRHTYFYPKKYPALIKRMVRDLQFWRRLVACSASMSFGYLLNSLPPNDCVLSSDACTSFGIAGVLQFHNPRENWGNIGGLFWQISWGEWRKNTSLRNVCPDNIGINVAEFLALLITCETFAEYCSGRITDFQIDNTSAKAWFDAARCPTFPFDRCAQVTHLYMMESAMKIFTCWVSSAANKMADVLSRERLSGKRSGHLVAGTCLRKVKPKWRHLISFLLDTPNIHFGSVKNL